ncbi:MAG: tRNA (N6-isopentenyl adenosine(37)-C2)-methylthiotransferase MiaB [Clostridia bacterium]|nr:tRNA (N6-isopentenyl adenosine(37)-C2)-methylthiotransferase MiaB [Clostridia bacterium]
MSEQDRNQSYIDLVREENESFFRAEGRRRRYYVDTYGCQQNESDSEILRGLAEAMGYLPASDAAEADLIVVNTCAVREHAEMRILGNVGAMSHIKKKNPDLVIVMTGCMMSEAHVRDRIKKSFPYVSGTLDTNSHARLPELVWSFLGDRKRRYYFDEARDVLAETEGLPRVRTSGVKAWLPIMKGCDNFCSYCIVPYVRGREASRSAESVLREARELVERGEKEITLLGQNVNSYRGIEGGFPALLRKIDAIPGKFRIRFMTSHPKDAGEELFRAMADCEKVAGNLHLPFQSGSDRILKAMNRGYTAREYEDKIAMARRYRPDLDITSDVIVGFPGETEEDYLATERLVRETGFLSLFTFIYSRREGTRAAKIPDDTPEEVIKDRFRRLLAVQDEISHKKNAALLGKTLEVLYDGVSREGGALTARTSGNRLVSVKADPALIGAFGRVRITSASTWSLAGEPAGTEDENG